MFLSQRADKELSFDGWDALENYYPFPTYCQFNKGVLEGVCIYEQNTFWAKIAIYAAMPTTAFTLLI